MHVNYAVNISLITATEDLLQNIWQENGLMSVSSIYIVMLALTYLFFSTIWGSIKRSDPPARSGLPCRLH